MSQERYYRSCSCRSEVWASVRFPAVSRAVLTILNFKRTANYFSQSIILRSKCINMNLGARRNESRKQTSDHI